VIGVHAKRTPTRVIELGFIERDWSDCGFIRVSMRVDLAIATAFFSLAGVELAIAIVRL
jgi:hypothetical protein